MCDNISLFPLRFSKNGICSLSNFVLIFPGDFSGEATPVPIPNTAVKLSCAESTWDAGPWKHRSLPGVIILDSSTVEYAAVNRGVVGSNPTRGAIQSKSELISDWI